MTNLIEKKILFLLFCKFSILLFLIWIYVTNTFLYYDDFFILEPVIHKLKTGSFPFLRYPEFSYLFYEKLIRVVNFFSISNDYYFIARAINSLLLPLNSILFFIVTKDFLKRNWALYGALIFGLSPAIFFSSASVKTESILLTQLFVSFLFAQKWEKDINKIIWPCLSGVIAALAFGTKYNPSVPSIFLIFILYAASKKEIKIKSLLRPFAIYSISAILTLILLFPSLFNFAQFLNTPEIKNDIIFSPYPNAFMALTEWNAFPAGRFSYAFFHSLPLNVGPIIFISFILGHLFKLIPKTVLITWGGFAFINFIAASLLSLYRLPYYYTLCVPYLIISHIYLLMMIFKKFPKLEVLKVGVVLVSIFYQFYNFRWYSDVFYEYAYVIQKTVPRLKLKYLGTDEGSKDFFNWELNLLNSSIKGDQVDTYVSQNQPKYIFTSAQMIENYCMYKKSKVYSRHCEYFSKLLRGENGYHLLWKKDIPLPFYNPLYQEKNFSFYLLEKES
ncbi:MAG: hypothetical protein DRQ88_04385 [Epsilonproteobacteria bacterium]|nr:MAG: hypothetical protein DRQ89_10055 [Campylobacterota bacterium]RLA66996.1 MAG: hypothetical protein DRQ88_04385 [Campylobacterota bacterium]